MSIIVLLSCKNNGTNFEGGATNNATAVMEVSKAMSPQDMADRDGIDHAQRIARHQHHIARLDGHIGAGAHGNTHIRRS